MRDDVRTLKRRFVRDLGEGEVTAYEASDGVHAFLLFEWHEPERTEAFDLLSRWVDRYLHSYILPHLRLTQV